MPETGHFNRGIYSFRLSLLTESLIGVIQSPKILLRINSAPWSANMVGGKDPISGFYLGSFPDF